MRNNRLTVRDLIKAAKEAKFNGSFTVEASYVVPIVIMILILIIGYTIYLHDIIVTEVAVAHMAEEGRMGLNYGRIPYSTQIYQDGFDSEEELEGLSCYMALYFSLYDFATMQGKSETEELTVTEKGAEVELIYNSSLISLLTTDMHEPEKKVYQSRGAYYPCVYAGITGLVYQMGKLLLEE